jgi:diaminopimelate decarboxylase
MKNRLPLFPASAKIQAGKLTIAECDLESLAREHGTPLYLYDRAELDSAASLYRQTMAESWPGKWSVTYAGKAFLCGWIARWACDQGLYVDCTGLGEIAMAVHAGVPRGQILVHGVNKSDEDLLAAFEHAGTIVVDNLSELRRIVRLRETSSFPVPDLWIRLLPGLAVDTHSYTQTGHSESKFGLGAEEFVQAVAFCRENRLPFNGIHFHQGSQFRDPAPLGPAIASALDLALELGMGDTWHLSPGGGWGVSYHEDDLPHPSIEAYVKFVTENVLEGVKERGLALPHLHVEPGRSLVARAGVALYRVGTVKQSSGRRWVLIDGGMADNPRHALYGAKYSALTVEQHQGGKVEPVWVAGPFCESGDVIIENLPMEDIHEGDLLAVPVCGAYHLSMASNYNGARRPAALLLENGGAQVILARETVKHLLAREN